MPFYKSESMIIHIATNKFFRLRLEDGTCVFMSWHNYLGPIFYRDKAENREIENWYENELICNALDWFTHRGNKA